MRHWLALPLLLALATACGAAHQRPVAMVEVSRVRAGAAVQDAKQLAPQVYRAAENLRVESEQAFDAGRLSEAQILAEHALATYRHATVLARLAEGERRLAEASQSVESKRTALAQLDERQQRVAAEADDLEMRIRVARDAQPLAENEPASPARERARLQAARSMALEARLLCVAARLLSPKLDGLEARFDELDQIDATLAASPKTAPIDRAIQMRSACLALLATARRPALRDEPEESPGDALLSALSEANFEPVRDDRGVAVTLRDAFQGSALATDTKTRLTALGQVAAEHPDHPLLVVVHRARGEATGDDEKRGREAATALEEAGAPRVEVRAAGDAQPVVPSGRPGAAERNTRVEIVFVTPGW